MKVLKRDGNLFSLNGAAVAQAMGVNGLVQCCFPAVTRYQLCASDDEAELFILSQLAWFCNRVGVSGPALGEGEPCVAVTCWTRQRLPPKWEAHEGVYRVHDGSVEAKSLAIVERNQRLVLRAPVDHTGIDERLYYGDEIPAQV